MRCAPSVVLAMVLLAGSLSPPAAYAQEARAAPSLERSRGFALEQNSPNPVEADTWIPFYLDDSLFEDRDSVRVTLRIYNILRQVVAFGERRDPTGQRGRILNLEYAEPGRQLAYWNGKDTAGRRVPSGVYYCQLVVEDEQPLTRKLIVINRRRRGLLPWFGNH